MKFQIVCGCADALRVPPAETRLTVYRRIQVSRPVGMVRDQLFKAFLFELGVSRACSTRYCSPRGNGTRPAVRVITLPVGMVHDQLFESLFRWEWYKTSCSKHYSPNRIGTRPAVQSLLFQSEWYKTSYPIPKQRTLNNEQ